MTASVRAMAFVSALASMASIMSMARVAPVASVAPVAPMVRVSTIAGLALALTLAMAPARAADAQAGRAKAVQCQACHGLDGMSKLPEAPNLAGQNEQYLIKALKDYRSGKRKDEMMTMMAKPLTDADIANLAAFYHGLKPQ